MGNEWLIDPADCARQLGSSEFRLVDCRFSLADTEWGRHEYRQSHIPGAVYAHMDDDLSGHVTPGITGRHPLPDSKEFIRTLEKWGISEHSHVVIYDQSHGGLAARLWWMLRWMGHDKTSVMDGGWAEWTKMNLPVDAKVPVIKASRFRSNPRPEMIIDMSGIREWIDDPTHTIIDAREHLRYTGETEPIDPVAGHIPGACNVPFLENINKNGKWKSPAELRLRFAEIINDRPEQSAVYCGSGVTACHNILALNVAGFRGMRLYPGSWSEWIASGENEISTGT